MTQKLTQSLYAVALAVAIALLYSFGLNNQLLFDDARLTDGTIFDQYGSVLTIKIRALSYGSFVWIRTILGEGWAVQRGFNIGLHIATALALYALVLDLLKNTHWAEDDRRHAGFSSRVHVAARLGVAFWALNPVAVYAVAYLIQRSILMATLWVVLMFLSFLRGLASGKPAWWLATGLCYMLAMLSKEYAVTSILLLVPLYVFYKRPPAGLIGIVLGIALLLLGAMGLLLYGQLSAVVGNVFDETSRAFAVQLEQQRPGISKDLFLLSIINQASLFFQYGLLWLVPVVGWMSIDLRPAFPLVMLSWQLAGLLGWLALVVLGAWLVLRRSDSLGLLGLCLLLPSVMFMTEFVTVWLQDPFVLYRSYLWSIAIPALLALVVFRSGLTGGPFSAICLLLLAGLVAFSFERIQSLQTPSTAWKDASTKIDLQAPANAVGRWRPFLNLGTEALDKEDYTEALRLFNQAEALGEPLGAARFNMGVCLQQLKQHPAALEQLAAAKAKGFTEAALFYHQGESLFAMTRFKEAFDSFSQALQLPQVAEAEQFTRLRQAEAAVGSNNYDAAITSYKMLLQKAPGNQRYQVGLSMAYVGKKDLVAAMEILDPAIAARPTGPALYARALTRFYMADRAGSAQDLALALRAEPNNPAYRQLQHLLSAPAGQVASKPGVKP
jgi:tetratricopeptide (TPR) repeat protein